MNSLTFAKNGRSNIAFTEATVLKTTEAAASVASNVATALAAGTVGNNRPQYGRCGLIITQLGLLLLHIRSLPGDDLVDWNSGVSVRPYVHKSFSDFYLIWFMGRPRPGMRTSVTSTRSKVKVT